MGEHKGHSPEEDNRKLLKLKFRQFTKSDVPLHETAKKKEVAPDKKKTAIKFEKSAPSPSRKSAATRTTKDAASSRPKEKSPAKSVRSARHKKSPAEEKSARRGRAHMRSASIRRAHAKRLQDEQTAKERMARERAEQERRRRGRSSSRRLYRASDDDEDSEYGWEMVAPSEEEERETREWFVNAARVIREEDEEERDDEHSEQWKDLMRQILACTNPRQEEEETLELLTEYDAPEGEYGEAPPRGGRGSRDRADRAEAPKLAASREKADEAHPQARRLLHIVKESNMLEESLYAEQNKVLRDFFERGMTDPTPKILSLLEKSMNYIIDTALYKTEQLAEPIDNELRKFVLDRDVAKVHLLDTMLACPEYLPLNWGGKLVILEPKKSREKENPISSPSLSPISITWSTLFRGIKDALVGSPRPDPPKKTEDKTKWEL